MKKENKNPSFVHNELHRIALGVYTSRKKAKEARKEILKKDI